MTATAALPARAANGRFRTADPPDCCPGCGWTLAEDLSGRLYCPSTRCPAYRQPIGVAAGVDPGALTAADLDVDR